MLRNLAFTFYILPYISYFYLFLFKSYMFINHVLRFKYQPINLKVNVDSEMMTEIFFNYLTPELNPSEQHVYRNFLPGILLLEKKHIS